MGVRSDDRIRDAIWLPASPQSGLYRRKNLQEVGKAAVGMPFRRDATQTLLAVARAPATAKLSKSA